MTTRDSISTDAYAAAATILASREAIVSVWQTLLDPTPHNAPANRVVVEQLDACVVAFAGYLIGEDLGDSIMAARWREMRPTRELVATATVAMGAFVEALRQELARSPDLSFDLATLIPAATRFVRETLLAILQSIALDPSSPQWDEAGAELERARARREARIAALTDIARAVSTARDPDDLVEQIHAACTRIVNGDDFAIFLRDPATGGLTPALIYERGVRRRDLEHRPYPVGLSRIVTETQAALNVSNYLEACGVYGVEPNPTYVTEPPLAWMGAPLVQGGQSIGAIGVFSRLLPFDREDLETLAGIARHTAVALENTRLIQAERRRVNQLKVVNQFARQIVTLRDPETLLSTAVDLIHDLFGYSLVSIFLTDDDGRVLALRAHSDPALEPELLNLRIEANGRGIVAEVARQGEPALVGDVAADSRYLSTPQTAATRAEVAVPILRAGVTLGVLDVQSTQPHAFDDHDLTTLMTIADQVALALENARLFKEEAERRQALALMLATTRAAGSSLVLDEVLERLAQGIAEAAGASNCTIYLLDEDAQFLLPAAAVAGPDSPLDPVRLRSLPLRLDDCPEARHIMEERAPFAWCDIPKALDAVNTGVAAMLGGAAALAVPLVAKERVLGIALVVAEKSREGFLTEQLRLLRGVADSAALAVENARLYARSQGLAIAEERGRLAQEIHDTLAQGLTAISLHLDLADAYLPAKPEQAAEKVRRALEMTRQNLEEARRSVLDLRAARLHQTALPEALRRLLQSFATDTGIETEFGAEGLSGRLSARVEMGLYRIAEEALSNIRRHAAARHVRVQVSASGGEVSLTIADDGAGFDPEAIQHDRRNGAGFGLVGIRERARLLRGNLTLTSTPGQGTTLVVTVPYEGSLAGKAEPKEPRT